MNKEQLIARGKELGIDVEPLANNTEREKAIAEAEAKIPLNPEGGTEAEAEKKNTADAEVKTDQEAKDKAVADAEEKAKTDLEAEEKAAGIYTDPRQIKWSFKKNAPKTINIDGRPMTQQEILDDESIISELAYGNSGFLQQHF